MCVPRVVISVFILLILSGSIAAADSSSAPGASPVAASHDHQVAAGPDQMAAAPAAIPPGTVITMSNWRQFQDYMPDGMVSLFEGKYFWKMPADLEMDVGPTVINPLPKGFLDATEKGAAQVRLVDLPDGGLTISGYQGGLPFPDATEPHRGWKILANFWYRYMPHLVVNTSDNLGFGCTQDSFGSINCAKSLWVYRQLAYKHRPGDSGDDPWRRGQVLHRVDDGRGAGAAEIHRKSDDCLHRLE
jgi:Protein of unknown function (DUF1329)